MKARKIRQKQIFLDPYPSADREINMIKAGMREVVEVVEKEGVMYQSLDTLKRWQAQLEEWGIKDGLEE